MFHQPSLNTPVWCVRHLDSYFSPTLCRLPLHSLVQEDLLLLGLPSVLVVHEDQAPHLVHLFHLVLAAPQCRGRSLCSHCLLHSECQHSSGACTELQLYTVCSIVLKQLVQNTVSVLLWLGPVQISSYSVQHSIHCKKFLAKITTIAGYCSFRVH